MVGSTFKNIKKKKKNIFKIQVKGEFNKIEDINDFNNKFQKKFSFLIKKLKPDFVVLTGDDMRLFQQVLRLF